MERNAIRLFISHSSKDSPFVQALIDLLRVALNLRSKQIRCTSIDGHRLPGGANTNEQLKQEVHQAEAFIGVLSTESIKSVFVIFELGARWGANLHFFPIIAPGISTDVLKGPLTGINAFSSTRPQLQQLLYELSMQLDLKLEPPASFDHLIVNILQINRSTLPEYETTPSETSADKKTLPGINPNLNENDTVRLIIWKIDESDYYENGYSLEQIAEYSDISIPRCQLALDSLIRKNHVQRKKLIGSTKRGLHYSLTDAGRQYLVKNGL